MIRVLIFMCLLLQSNASQILDAQQILLSAGKAGIGNTRCQKQLAEFGSKFLKEEWTIRLLDAWTKFPSGILEGNIMDLGNYDECIDIDHSFENGGENLLGKYCGSSFIVSLPVSKAKNAPDSMSTTMNFSLQYMNTAQVREAPTAIPFVIGSLCLPDACNPSDLKPILNSLKLDAFITTNDALCHTKEYYTAELDGYNIFAMVFFGIIIGLMILSTSYDFYLQKSEKKSPSDLLIAFSVITNGKKLLSTKKIKGQVTCLNGIRVMSMMWVILAHQSTEVDFTASVNALEARKMKESVGGQFIHGAHLAVDTFLFLSAFLLTYTFVKTQSKPGARFNLIIYYLHRYLRLTPALLGLYVYVIGLMKYFGSGPTWPFFVDYTVEPCKKWWWSVFLYVQNYVNMSEICVIPTWYISMDLQIFILTPIVLIPLVKWRKWATYGLYCLLAITAAIPAAITYTYNTQMFTQDYFDYYYYLTHARLAPFVIGMILGLHMYETENKPFKIHWLVNLVIWMIILVGMGAIVFTGGDVIYHHERVKSTVYITLHRPLWTVGLCWIVFASTKGYGGIINWFLSLSAFQVLARLTYSMYLLHFSALMAVGFAQRVPAYYDYLTIIHQFWGHFVFTSLAALFWTLAFESPMIVIEKLLFGSFKPAPKPNKDANLNEISIVTKSV